MKNGNSLQKNENEQSSQAQGMALRHLLLPLVAEAMTSRQYQVFVLRFLEGMSQKEIAAELDISPSGVSRLYSSALVKLRYALGYEFEE